MVKLEAKVVVPMDSILVTVRGEDGKPRAFLRMWINPKHAAGLPHDIGSRYALLEYPAGEGVWRVVPQSEDDLDDRLAEAVEAYLDNMEDLMQ